MFVQRHFIKTKKSQIGAFILSRKEYNIILLFGIIPIYIKVTDLTDKVKVVR